MKRHASPLANSLVPPAPVSGNVGADIRSLLRDGIAQLERAHVPSAALAAELLLMHALGQDRSWLYSHPEMEIEPAERDSYFQLVGRRASGIPTQHLTGHQEFWGLNFEVTPDVLIPRPETEHVIEVALQHLLSGAEGNSARRNEPFRIADVGTGSGCIAIALASELPSAQIIATDISTSALEVARRNAERHHASARIKIMESNLLEVLLVESLESQPTGQKSPLLDVIVSNPPYISRCESATLAREVRDHEPHVALFGGEIGTEIYAPLIAQAAILLKAGGIIVLELGESSADHVLQLLNGAGWIGVGITNDLAGIPRIASAERSTN